MLQYSADVNDHYNYALWLHVCIFNYTVSWQVQSQGNKLLTDFLSHLTNIIIITVSGHYDDYLYPGNQIYPLELSCPKAVGHL